ncbi:Caffeic acid 3-O-methyltransferase [Linum perenne]
MAGNTNNMNEKKVENFEHALCIANGIVVPMTMQAANELRILDIIAEAGTNAQLTASEVVSKMASSSTNKNPNAAAMVDRILRLLTAHSIVDCTMDGSDRRYSLNSVSKYFVRNEENGASLAQLMSVNQDKLTLQSWYELKDAVLEGGVPFNRAAGTTTFDYFSRNPKLSQVFSLAMYNLSSIIMKALMNCYKGFEELKQIVDVGGGFGDSAKAIISKYPHIKAINFDLPHVIEQAPPIPGVEHIAGDMFESVPRGEAIFMKSVMHDWSDEHCLRLLKKCYEAVSEQGKVIVVDMVAPMGAETTMASKMTAQTDMLMMTMTQGGKERTKDEFMELATGAGFRGTTFQCSVFSAIWVIEFYK